MKEFVEKLIDKLEELQSYACFPDDFVSEEQEKVYQYFKTKLTEILELAEEYQSRVMIDGQYCWQTCSATEHCKECNRLCNGDIDYYENYDCLAEEYNNGWIACSERLPQESEPVGTLCEVVNVMLKNGIVTSGWCNRYLEKWYVLDHYHDYPLPYEYKDVIAWQPLPQPYKPQESEWKDKVMKHFTNVE